MEIDKVKAFIAAMQPPAGEGLRHYIAAAVRSIGGNSDAALARTVGVPAPTIASWKKRGVIPEEKAGWFPTTLAEKILQFSARGRADESIPRAAVVQLLVQTGGNPLGLPSERAVLLAPHLLEPLFALSGFLYFSRPDHWAQLAPSDRVRSLTELLEGALALDGRHIPVPAQLPT